MAHERKESFSLKSLHQAIGAEGEEHIKDLMEGFGLLLEVAGNWNSSFDFVYNGKNIEVKTSYMHNASNGQGTTRKRAQFNFTAKYGNDDYYAILVLIDSDNVRHIYFVPGSAIQSKMVQITSHPSKYSGQYAQYYWDIDGFLSYVNG